MAITYAIPNPQASTTQTQDVTPRVVYNVVPNSQTSLVRASDTGIQLSARIYPDIATLASRYLPVTVRRSLKLRPLTQSSALSTAIAALMTTGYEIRASGELTYRVGADSSRFSGSAWVHGDTLSFLADIEGSNLSGLTLHFDAVNQTDPTTVVLSRSVGSGIQMGEPADIKGVEKLQALVSIDTSAISGIDTSIRETLKYHCWMTDNQGRVYTIEQGTFTLETKF